MIEAGQSVDIFRKEKFIKLQADKLLERPKPGKVRKVCQTLL